MFRMLDEMNSTLSSMMIQEKNDREVTEETLIALLDETCNRIGNSLRK